MKNFETIRMDVVSNSDENVPLPNMNRQKGEEAKSFSVLSKSIETGDLSYIQEFLMSDNRDEELKKLSTRHKEDLLPLLAEFLDRPLRVRAIRTIYTVINMTGDATGLCKKLIGRSNDFNKLVYLKGKIDFLKYQQKTEQAHAEPDAQYPHIKDN